MKKQQCKLLSKDEVLTDLAKRELDVLLTLGAGDIDTLVVPITTYLKTKMDRHE